MRFKSRFCPRLHLENMNSIERKVRVGEVAAVSRRLVHYEAVILRTNAFAVNY
jgi:hypothetical protein